MKRTEQRSDATSVAGLHIYEDEKGRTIYYKPRKMTGYVIKDENVKTYTTYSSRYVIAGAAGILAYVLLEESEFAPYIGVVLGLAVLALLQYRFHYSFLANLVQIHNYVPKEKVSFLHGLSGQDLWRLVMKAILYPVFGILLLYLFYLKQVETLEFIIGWIVLIITLGLGGMNAAAAIYQRKHPVPLEKPVKKKK